MLSDAPTQYRGFTITPDGANLAISLGGVIWARATNRETAEYMVDLFCADIERATQYEGGGLDAGTIE